MTFFIRVRYWGAFFIICIGVWLTYPGEALIKLGKWIGSPSK
jgi:hypothetical protein